MLFSIQFANIHTICWLPVAEILFYDASRRNSMNVKRWNSFRGDLFRNLQSSIHYLLIQKAFDVEDDGVGTVS